MHHGKKKRKKRKKRKKKSKSKEKVKLIQLPHGFFTLCLFDAPWWYCINKHKNHRGMAVNHYDLMKTEDIIQLLKDIQYKIPGDPDLCPIVAKNGVVLIWCTGPKMPEMLKICKAFHLTIVEQVVSWCKSTKGNGMKMGAGYYSRPNWEGLFLCVPSEVNYSINYEHYYGNLMFPSPYEDLPYGFFEHTQDFQQGSLNSDLELLGFFTGEDWDKNYDIKQMGSKPLINTIYASTDQIHSKKPKDATTLINQLFVNTPHNYKPYEVFARKSDGDKRWFYVGKEKDKFNAPRSKSNSKKRKATHVLTNQPHKKKRKLFSVL